jgi:hypothetical protein
MSTQSAGPGSASIGVGPSNDSHAASQQASGGSGGSQLTRSLDDTGSGKPSKHVDVQDDAAEAEPEGAGSALTAATRGPQDTRSHQAGATSTGLGAPETGAKQQPGDLAPKK